MSSRLLPPRMALSTTLSTAGSSPSRARRFTGRRPRETTAVAASRIPTPGGASGGIEVLQGPPAKFAPTGGFISARKTVKDILNVEAGPQDIGLLSERLGIPFSKVDTFYESQVDKRDPLINNYFEYELGKAEPVIKDRYRSALPFWENYLKASPQVLQWIAEGVDIEFMVEPSRLYCKNNKSAINAPSFVTEAVSELLKFGLIEEVEEIPFVVNSLSVAYNTAGKARLCLDMSHVNNHCKSPSFQLDDQRTWFNVCKSGIKYHWVFDLKSCYHQLMLKESAQKYFGFAWKDLKTDIVHYYVFVVVPFGFLKAPYVCKYFFHPLIKVWRKKGIPTCLFYDDCVSGAYSKEAAKMFADKQRIDLLNAHVLVSPSKSDFSASSSVVWLGHLFDLQLGVVSITEKRLELAEERMRTVERNWPVVSARQVARVVGSIGSCSLVFQEEEQFMTRFLQQIINYKEHEEFTWNKKFDVGLAGVADQAWRELSFWKKHLREGNSRSFKDDIRSCRIVWGDAGETGEGAHFDFGEGETIFHSRYDEEEGKASSTFRELSALHDLFLSVPHMLQGLEFVYATDSLSCHLIMSKGSSNPKLHMKAAACRGLARALKVKLHTAWIPRSFNDFADQISKKPDFDAWSLTPQFFLKIQALCGESFSLDAFADDKNAKCEKFYSRDWCPGTAGVDSLCHDWRGETVLAVPPPRLLLQTLMKLEQSKCSAMLVYPECSYGLLLAAWQSSRFRVGKVAEWRFAGKGKLYSDVVTRFDENFDGYLVVVKLDFS